MLRTADDWNVGCHSGKAATGGFGDGIRAGGTDTAVGADTEPDVDGVLAGLRIAARIGRAMRRTARERD